MSNYNTKQHICVECGNSFSGRKKKYCSKECSDEVRRRKNRERMRTLNPPKPDVTIQCEWCGKKHTVPARTAHQARFCSNKCNNTWWSRVVHNHKPIEEYKDERRKQKLIRQRKLEKERLERSVTRNCIWCGNMFETLNERQLTCSSECSRKRLNRVKWERKEARLNERNIVDTDITLIKLYKRDKGVCHICNEPCDYGDKKITSEGYFIAGETYPSIDHVIPISKGGKHSWKNVKLAHHKCNGIKSDRIIKRISKTLA